MSELIGRTLDQYQIIELIQDTGSTKVYKGFQSSMNRYVAVEVLKSQEQQAVQDFMHQSELLANIQHPNILPVYESKQAEGLAFRAMRFAEGGVLQAHLTQYSNLNAAAVLISGVVAGLGKIHAQGYVHGNLQTNNIYLDEAGQPLLTDFSVPQTSAQITAFSSPEQRQGGVVDKRSDVYALGVLLYTLLTGATPPAGEVVSVRNTRPDVPDAVEKVIFKAMAQDPGSRFQSAHEFQNALSVAMQPVTPAPAAVAPQPQAYQPAPVRSGPNWAAIILGILLVVVVIGGIAFFANQQGSQASPGAPAAPVSPPVQAEPPKEPEQPEAPIEAPDDSPPANSPGTGEPIQLPEVCNSLGIAGGFILLGSVLNFRRRSSSKRKRDYEL